MDTKLGNANESEEIWNEDEDYSIDNAFEQETCGICIDIVIDRGVLDCCDHWFCFACIDNWATITNLCPICKNEFQVITCLPVYDTVRSITSEEFPLSRNEDWSIQGKNNALSFPSYYISEDAVKCLENDGCKIRNALQETEEDSNFDTSIACDSCDIWYHAFCVGFNPESTSEKSWLCPRCINNQMLQHSGVVSSQSLVKYSASQTAEIGWRTDSTLSGKISVSVADTGETALVVSMISEKPKVDCDSSLLDRLACNMDLDIAKSPLYSDNDTSEAALQQKYGSCIPVKLECSSEIDNMDLIVRKSPTYFDNETSEAALQQRNGSYIPVKLECSSDIDNNSEMFFDLLPEIIDFKPYGDLKEHVVASLPLDTFIIEPRNDITESQSPPTLQDVPLPLCYSEANDESKSINTLETRSDLVYSDGFTGETSMAICTFEAKDEPDNKSCLDTCLVSSSAISADNMAISCNKDAMVDICQSIEKGCKSKTEHSLSESNLNMARTIYMDENNNRIRKREHENIFPGKKPNFDKMSISLPTRNQPIFSSLDGSQMCLRKNRGASLKCSIDGETVASNIMSIIQESGCASHDTPTKIMAANNFVDKKDSTGGLRVKKIVRRVGEKRESSLLAQEIGKEIREVVQKRTLKDVGKNDFDEKLLAAFRAAMVRPQTDLTSRSKHLAGSKKPLSVKGKKRENLTKKIYGTSSGRRRHAWTRDLEIEFWKHRCKRGRNEKVETLQSVLELLKKATNPNWDSYMQRDSHVGNTDSILSRVYVADASLFPRKDDIKPLSALSGSGHLDKLNFGDEKNPSIVVKGTLHYNKDATKSPIQHQANLCTSTSNQKTTSGKAMPDAIQCSGSSCSKESMPCSNEKSCPSDTKSDKRKWALDVLARKTASGNMSANNGQENDDLLKGNYPLLALLPQDMRPMLASTRHNKISASIRQAQLYRITEHYLRKANLPVIRRTAETELAVADAVNVEKLIFGRSNSKLVYVNLCSQTVSQLASKREPAEASPSTSLVATTEITKITMSDTETYNKPDSVDTNAASLTLPSSELCNKVPLDTNASRKACSWNNAEEALKMAGLFSDSPPSSPYCGTKDAIEEECVQENVDESLNYYTQENSQSCMDTLPSSELCNKVPLDTHASCKACSWNNAEEALKMAGLFSDSPPSSPYRGTKDAIEEECVQENVDESLNYYTQENFQSSMDTLPSSELCNKVPLDTNASHKACSWSNAEEALKMAGLFSDSPPSSSYRGTKDAIEEECVQENVNESLNYYTQENAQYSMDTDQNALVTQTPGEVVLDCIEVRVDQQKESEPENCNEEVRTDNFLPTELPEVGICSNILLEEFDSDNKKPAVEVLEKPPLTLEEKNMLFSLREESEVTAMDIKCCRRDADVCSTHNAEMTVVSENFETHSTEILQLNPVICDNIFNGDILKSTKDKSDLTTSVSNKVEAYIKEHVRPLCKSGVITVEQYRWAVGKTLAKVMKYHHKAKSANFLIREGENVKKLAEQYIKASQKTDLR